MEPRGDLVEETAEGCRLTWRVGVQPRRAARLLAPLALKALGAQGRKGFGALEALARGEKAALRWTDVVDPEPLPPESPLWEMPGVIITPHVGAQSKRRIDDATELFCDNLQRFRSGRPLRNLIDKQLGFPRREGAAD